MTIIRRLTRLRLNEFYHDYYHGCYPPDEKMGQAFMNRYFNNTFDPDLWSEQSDAKACEIIEEKYTEIEKVA